ncbi:MAG: 3-hydroxyacyl-CoA dehydrogenase [Hyphomicrobiales bacterium]
MKVALVGTGVIGRAWAVVFARAGHSVALYDENPAMLAQARDHIAGSLEQFRQAGIVSDPAMVLTRITASATLAEALAGADYVQESVVENVDVKRSVFQAMDSLAPSDAILASSASAIPGSDFMDVPGRARCLVAHPVSPPSLVPLVELVPTPWTSPEVVARTRQLMHDVGQSPVVLHKEIPGFVLNRLQAAVISEAMHLVAEGVISPDDLDCTMRDGLGLRWSFMGPFETMDLNADDGIEGYLRRYAKSYETMCALLRVTDAWRAEAINAVSAERRRLVPADKLAERRAWRDRNLLRLKKARIDEAKQ